jgi:hypothetical protein
VRSAEHMTASDKGVAMLRRQIRSGITRVVDGNSPLLPQTYGTWIVPTYNNETILKVPQRTTDGNDDGDAADQAVLRTFGEKICGVVIESAELAVGERQKTVEQKVREMQKTEAFYAPSIQPQVSQTESSNV